MLKKILVVVAALFAVLLVVIATRPATYRVERSLVVDEGVRRLYDTVADLQRWSAWSPWARLDPAMKSTFTGTPAAPGSVYTWSGNDKVGEGRMTVTEVHPPLQVKIKLEFLKPWQSTAETVFDLYAEKGGTRVVWIMTGTHDFLGKAMSLFMDMDKAIGPDFERGLATLKQITEDGTLAR
ncbi:MAG: SRPBCC family protein [Anaeromyxobacter sp.]|nr:SRPBCC family protein [Anaeromyxobacter sp.]MBL0274494.1 SRPBCC family protein [Anaeromyxobacter sp.]